VAVIFTRLVAFVVDLFLINEQFLVPRDEFVKAQSSIAIRIEGWKQFPYLVVVFWCAHQFERLFQIVFFDPAASVSIEETKLLTQFLDLFFGSSRSSIHCNLD
jgi:hypothetical protein